MSAILFNTRFTDEGSQNALVHFICFSLELSFEGVKFSMLLVLIQLEKDGKKETEGTGPGGRVALKTGPRPE